MDRDFKLFVQCPIELSLFDIAEQIVMYLYLFLTGQPQESLFRRCQGRRPARRSA